jgi:hypothetical protein
MRDLLHTVAWINKTSLDEDLGFVKKPKKAADSIVAAEIEGEPAETKVVIKAGESNKQTRARQKTQSFIDLVKSGLSPEDAAARIGLDLGEVTKVASQTDMRRIVSETLEVGHIRSDLRKEYLRAGLNKMVTEALVEGDRKSFGDLYKLAASDPEIGLTGPSVAIQNNINISELGDILKEFMPPANEGSGDTPQSILENTIDSVPEQT